jgi:hypothetical protein
VSLPAVALQVALQVLLVNVLAVHAGEEDCRIRKIDDLSEKQLKVMAEWEVKYEQKYPIIGTLIRRSGTIGQPDFVPAEGEEAVRLAASGDTRADTGKGFVLPVKLAGNTRKKKTKRS